MDFLIITEDLGIKLSLSDYDNISPKRLKMLIDIQQERIEAKAKRAEAERKKQEREAARQKIMRK